MLSVAALFFLVPSSLGQLPNYCNLIEKHEIPAPPANAELKHVTILHRHGDRVEWTTERCWDNDVMSEFRCDLRRGEIPVTNEQTVLEDSPIFRLVYSDKEELNMHSCYTGQLTERGLHQHQVNGEALHRMYVKTGFLSSSFNESEIFLRSDVEPRVLQSIQALIPAMFPDINKVEGHKANRLVNLYVREFSIDPIPVNFNIICPKDVYYDKLMAKYPLPEQQKFEEEVIIPFKKKIGQEISQDPKSVDFTIKVDCMGVHLCHGYDLPGSLDKDFYEEALAANGYHDHFKYRYPSLKERAPLLMGVLMDGWYKEWKKVISGDHHKLSVYSGHDSTVIGILTTLGFDMKITPWPKYAAVLDFELYEMEGSFWIRFVHNYKVQRLPFCPERDDGLCPFEVVEDYLLPLLPHDLEKQCQVTDEEKAFLYDLDHLIPTSSSSSSSLSYDGYFQLSALFGFFICSFVAGWISGAQFGVSHIKERLHRWNSINGYQDTK